MQKAMELLKIVGLEEKADVYPKAAFRWTAAENCYSKSSCYGSGDNAF